MCAQIQEKTNEGESEEREHVTEREDRWKKKRLPVSLGSIVCRWRHSIELQKSRSFHRGTKSRGGTPRDVCLQSCRELSTWWLVRTMKFLQLVYRCFVLQQDRVAHCRWWQRWSLFALQITSDTERAFTCHWSGGAYVEATNQRGEAW